MKLFKEIGRNARVDWILILAVSVVIAIVLAIGGLNLYNAVQKGDWRVNDTAVVVPASKFNEKVISSFISTFDERDEASGKARAGYAGVGDPSI